MEITTYTETANELYSYVTTQGEYSCPCAYVSLENLNQFKIMCERNGVNISIDEIDGIYKIKQIKA